MIIFAGSRAQCQLWKHFWNQCRILVLPVSFSMIGPMTVLTHNSWSRQKDISMICMTLYMMDHFIDRNEPVIDSPYHSLLTGSRRLVNSLSQKSLFVFYTIVQILDVII